MTMQFLLIQCSSAYKYVFQETRAIFRVSNRGWLPLAVIHLRRNSLLPKYACIKELFKELCHPCLNSLDLQSLTSRRLSHGYDLFSFSSCPPSLSPTSPIFSSLASLSVEYQYSTAGNRKTLIINQNILKSELLLQGLVRPWPQLSPQCSVQRFDDRHAC